MDQLSFYLKYWSIYTVDFSISRFFGWVLLINYAVLTGNSAALFCLGFPGVRCFYFSFVRFVVIFRNVKLVLGQSVLSILLFILCTFDEPVRINMPCLSFWQVFHIVRGFYQLISAVA